MTSRLTLPLYLIASAASLFGNASIAIVLPWLVLERTGDPALAGTVAAISAAPAAIAALVGGHLIDTIGRRRVSVLADVGSAVAVAALAIVDHSVGLNLGWFIALGVLGALFDVPGMTGREALVASVSETSGASLDKVASWRGALFGVSFLAGPAIAGWLLTVLPAIDVVWITAACSALAAAALAIMPLAPSTPTQADSSPLAGLSHIVRSRPLLVMVLLSVASAMLVGPLMSVVLPAHFRALAAPGLLGLTLSAYALGSVLGSGLYGVGFAGRRWAAWVVSNICYGASGLLIATLAGFWPVFAGMVLAGIGSGLAQPIVTVVLTGAVPDHLRGRVFGTMASLAMVVSPVGLGLMALLLRGADLRVGAWALAAGWIVVAVAALIVPGMKGYIRAEPTEERDADHRPVG